MTDESIGFLEVDVKTANGALPVEGASVNIYSYLPEAKKAKDENLIYSLLTDKNGKTTRVALNAKDKALSMTPGNESPFTVYTIAVSKDGFYNNSYLNVPVFQGITSLQPVELIPLLEYASPTDDLPSSTVRFSETPNTKL